MDWLGQFEILGKVTLAMLLGGLIGLDREMAHKPAGLRTFMLVAGAAALLVSLGDALVEGYVRSRVDVAGTGPDGGVVRADPIRIIEAVIAGVSFLGAGMILRHEASDQVRGLTTGASMLFSAAVGLAVSLEQFVLAGGATILALITLRLLAMLPKRELDSRSQR
jgi:putative Mg2+ transporter-C (MgtC) family protein